LNDIINQTFSQIEQKNSFAVISCLKVNSDVSLADVQDERGYTLLHEACFQNFEELVQQLVKYAKETLTS